MSRLINYIKRKFKAPKVEHTFGIRGGDVLRQYQQTKRVGE